MLSEKEIKKCAREAGFDRCGVAPSRPLEEHRSRFTEWLRGGFSSTLTYLERNVEKRLDPSRLVAGAQSVIVCAVSYRNAISGGYPEGWSGPKIASYACARDYHDVIRGMLLEMFERLRAAEPTLRGRVFVDTAPVLEKAWAVEAGLGWIGRNSLLVVPGLGSFVLLGELIVDSEVDRYDQPYCGTGCGSCWRCVESCPAGAIRPDRTLDTSRCISRLTIERGDPEPEQLHGWIFGCDACQSVCPYNRSAPDHRSSRFDPVYDPRQIDRTDWAAFSEEEFDSRFGATPLARAGLERMKKACGGENKKGKIL